MTKKKSGRKPREKPAKGPEPERLKIGSNWMDAIDATLKVKRPKGGWPK